MCADAYRLQMWLGRKYLCISVQERKRHRGSQADRHTDKDCTWNVHWGQFHSPTIMKKCINYSIFFPIAVSMTKDFYFVLVKSSCRVPLGITSENNSNIHPLGQRKDRSREQP